MNYRLAMFLAGLSLACGAQVPAGYPARYAETISSANREGKLVIYSATDLPAAAPLLKEFRAHYPRIEVDYQNMSSIEVYKRFVSESVEGGRSADVLWSPAMDLQMKLVNDGQAQPYKSPEAASSRPGRYGATRPSAPPSSRSYSCTTSGCSRRAKCRKPMPPWRSC
jgi:iron(III) transport system substrate-binding protein